MKIIDRAKFKKKLWYICKTYGISPALSDKILKAVDNSMTELIDCRDNWISVTDKLPENRGERCLCYFNFESTQNTPDVICENTYLGSGHWQSDGDAVTHWMPLVNKPVKFEYADKE